MENLFISGLSGCFSGSEKISFTGENVSDGKTGTGEFLNVLKDIIGKDFTANLQMQSGTPLNVDNGTSLPVSALQVAAALQLPDEAGEDLSAVLMSILSAYGLNVVPEAMSCVPESGIEVPKLGSTSATQGDKEDAPYKEAMAILFNELCKIFNPLVGVIPVSLRAENSLSASSSDEPGQETLQGTLSDEIKKLLERPDIIAMLQSHGIPTVKTNESSKHSEDGVSGEILSLSASILFAKQVIEGLLNEAISEKGLPGTPQTMAQSPVETVSTDKGMPVQPDPSTTDMDIPALLYRAMNMAAQRQATAAGSEDVQESTPDMTEQRIQGEGVFSFRDTQGSRLYHMASTKTDRIETGVSVEAGTMPPLAGDKDMPADMDVRLKTDGMINKNPEIKNIHANMNFRIPEQVVDEMKLAGGDFNAVSEKNGSILKNIIAGLQNETIEAPQKDTKFSFKENDYMPFTKSGNFEAAQSSETEGAQTVEKGSFASMITDKIEKIIGQNQLRNTPMDMVMRMNINEKESLLIGLKREGQQIFVEIKTGSSSIMNLLQANKEVIIRNLEMKNVNANIFVNPDSDGGFERRENRRENRRGAANGKAQNNFFKLLETQA
ncbi:MAG: hypothetical protein NTX36_14990 [Proteobacteria bacterium]|nr:hypothetical protein [Pseudomonadota bacterium]